jgi:hypothetical protein
MTHPNHAAPAMTGSPPPLPSITASVLIETRLLVQAFAAWLTRG